MKFLKKNQVIVYVIVLMLMVAGYLNYTSNSKNVDLETSSKIEASDDMQMANIGDAKLVNSNAIENENQAGVEAENTTSDNEYNASTNTASNNYNEITKNNTQNDINNNAENNTQNETVDTNSNVSENKSENENEYFIKSKLDRDTMYSQMIETYEKVLNSSNSLETQKQTATQEITKISEIKNGIMICENLIKTKGFDNCIIFVNGESVSIIIDADELKQEEIAQIQNIISRELKAEIENIHISIK